MNDEREDKKGILIIKDDKSEITMKGKTLSHNVWTVIETPRQKWVLQNYTYLILQSTNQNGPDQCIES